MKYIGAFMLGAVALALPFFGNAGTTASITITPSTVIQGEPALITITSTSGSAVLTTSAVKNLKVATAVVPTFTRNGQTQGIYGVDIHKKPGTYDVVATFTDGTTATAQLVVTERPHKEAVLAIPEKLGGNTPAAVTNVVSTLAKENATLENLKTGIKTFWTKTFGYPVKNPVVTDPYGYDRLTGDSTIIHKGTDFKAEVGTPVLAINRGVVRVARTYTVYGKTIIVDHGLGVHSMYMHLSKISVNPGELVQKGQVIGRSGDTGYAEGPHLHLSIKVAGISIDPMKFFEILGEK